MATLALIGVAVFVGAVLQRISGTGTGLLLSPVLSLALGAATGVLVTNAMTVVTACVLLTGVWNRVDWSRWRLLCAGALVGVVPGALLVGALPAAWLQVVVGGAVLAGLAVSVGLRSAPPMPVRPAALGFGALGGLLNVTCGVAAAAMVVNARATRWDHAAYAATMQPTFAVFGALSVVAKLSLGAHPDLSALSWWLLPVGLAAVLAGGAVGAWAARRVSSERAKTVAMTLAGLGAAATVVRGLMAV